LAQHGTAVFSHEQTAGKGQRGKEWVSKARGNIALSILLKPAALPISDQFRLSVCTAVAVRNFFSKYAGSETVIKWPNDLYWKDRKAGGILIENVIKAHSAGPASWEWAVIGIGININQSHFPPALTNPVSLKQITGKTFEVVPLARELASIILQSVELLYSGGYATLLNEYLSHFYKKGEVVRLKNGTRVFEATIKGITPDGKLIVSHTTEEEFAVGEVEWQLK
jgi:BirA family biotin operon repressor/biotin-[acetyl-CoA-carboxylase] ligase